MREKNQVHAVPFEEYVDGNTVRQREIEIERERQRERERRKERVSRELMRRREEEERRSRRKAAVRRNQARELAMGKGYLFFLTVLGVLTAFLALSYIRLQTDLTVHLKTISRMEGELEDVLSDNAAIQKRIDTATDLKHIKEVAMNDLHMNYATQDQIVYYSVANADYMNQYSEIP